MCAKFAGEPKWRTFGQCFEGDVEAEADVEVESPPSRGAIAPGLLSGVGWKISERADILYRTGGLSLRRGDEREEEECWRIVPPSLLCACADCGISWTSSDGLGASSRRLVEQDEEECLRRRSMRWRFWRGRGTRIRSSREVIHSPEMGTLWDAFGPARHTGPGNASGCGIQRVVESVFSRDRVHDDEEKHRCILHFPSMREFFTHEEVERVLVPLGWRPLTKRGGWRRYFKSQEPTLSYGLPTVAKLPARSFVDAPKPIILDFVRTVNKRENRNIFCCWEHRGELVVSAGDRTILN